MVTGEDPPTSEENKPDLAARQNKSPVKKHKVRWKEGREGHASGERDNPGKRQHLKILEVNQHRLALLAPPLELKKMGSVRECEETMIQARDQRGTRPEY